MTPEVFQLIEQICANENLTIQKVEIKRFRYDDPKKPKDFHSVVVIGEDGKEKTVDCRELKLAYVDLS